MNHISGVINVVLASSAVVHGFECQLGEIKDYKMVFDAYPISSQH